MWFHHVGLIKKIIDRHPNMFPDNWGEIEEPLNTMQLVWDRGDQHLEIDVLANGTLEWFHMDRDTKSCESEEDLLDISPLLWQYIRVTAI